MSSSPVLNNLVYEKFRLLIYESSGIYFNNSNRSVLEGRLRECLQTTHLDSYEDYFFLVTSKENELNYLLDAVTTNLTKFFRNLPHYETLEHYTIPQLVEYKKLYGLDRKIRLWSAGCSTGEEAYTNAMCLAEWLPSDFSFEIVASDLSLTSLEIAKEGYYSQERCATIPSNFLKKYFTPSSKGGYYASEYLRSHITFDYHNLKYDIGEEPFDIIFCRNVLIYFDLIKQKDLVDRFYEVMTHYSYLFIGHSESLFGLETKFNFIKTNWACIYMRKS